MSGAGPDAVAAEAAVQVVRRHIDAVRSGLPEAMARDYASDAVIQRPDATIAGREAIAAYFAEVPARLAGGRVAFGDVTASGAEVAFTWRIVGGPADGTSGTDRCRVAGGLITHQVVALDTHDF